MRRTVEVWTNDPEKKMVIITVSVAASTDKGGKGEQKADDK